MDRFHLYNDLYEVLKTNERFCTDDGKLNKAVIEQAATSLDGELLSMLLSTENLKKHFFKEVNGMMVFDKVDFLKFIINKNLLHDDYSFYKERIGLTNEHGQYIADSQEVVLSWKYKDCMLEGGQTKEDQKHDEVFWNTILASDEINRLTEGKAFAGFKRYDKDGEHEVEHLMPNDNLIIKGNNLLALYSLKSRFPKGVKLILIDPPYYFTKPKPSDTFSYNSNFRLSTWLVFMRDRLKIARNLLANDGIILCHIKEDAIHWLKVLMEEIFHVDNFVETFIWKNTDNPDSLSNKSRVAVEYVVCYEKRKDTSIAYIGKETENGDGPILHTGNNIHELTFPVGSIRFNIEDGTYEGKPDRVELITPVIVENGVNKNEVVLKGEFAWSQDNLDKEYANGAYFLVKSKKFSVRVQKPEGTTMAPEKYVDEQYLSKAIGVGTNEDASSHLKKLGINFTNSKPESIVAFFLRAMTKENDWVLDFFLGSGTTCACAHKMNRHYIGIDQMDYIQTETCKRLRQVIEGEQGGVSQSVNWKGGGSFVYCELAKANETYREEIINAKEETELNTIWESMQATNFLSYKIDPKKIDVTSADFTKLTLEEKKRFLMECLDMNQLYIPFADMDNPDYEISAKDKELTREFYGVNENE